MIRKPRAGSRRHCCSRREIFFAALRTNRSGLIFMARIVVAGALISAVLATVQLALGFPAGLYPYGSPGAGVPTGIFANPNHQAQLMLAGLVLSGLLIRTAEPGTGSDRPRGGRRIPLGWLLVPIFMIGTVATQSRAGIFLMAPATLAATLIATGKRGLARVFGLAIAAIASLAVVAALALAGLPAARTCRWS